MTDLPSVGEAAIRMLEARGVDTVFGIPGVHTLAFYRGIAGSGLRHVTPRHEQGAGFMADGYGRVSGRPGVCVLITGAGMTNAATALAEATSDSSPVLVLSSVNARRDLAMGRGRLHELKNQQAAIAPLVGWSRTVMSGAELPGLMDRAFATFASGRPLPVHLEIPLDVLAEPYGGPIAPAAAPARPAPAPRAIAEAVRLIAGSRQPLLLLGGGAVDSADAARALAERIGAAVVTTNAGAGIVAADHPLSLGATLSLAATRRALAAADLVIVVGSELAETDHWTDRLPIGAPMLRIDIDPEELTGDYPAAVAMLADSRLALEALADALPSRTDAPRGWPDLADIRRAQRAELAEKEGARLVLVDGLRAALPRETILVTDMTQLAYAAAGAYPSYIPRGMLHPNGYGTLGFALPAAIGAKLAAPDRPVCAVVGDGGFQFTMEELACARELDLPLAIVLFNNDGYGQIAKGMRRQNIAPVGVELRNPDFALIARAYGCRHSRPANLAEFRRDVGRALAGPGPAIVEIGERLAEPPTGMG